MLIDYGAVPEHDTSLIDARGLDGDYDMRTIGHLKTIYAVTDTDEIYTASWSSAEYMAQPERRQIFGELGKGTAFRTSYYGPHFNWLHREHTIFSRSASRRDRLAINGTKPKKGPCGPF